MAAREGAGKLQAARRTDRINVFANLEAIRIAELCRGQRRARRVNLQDGQIGLLVAALDLRREGRTVRHVDGDLVQLFSGVFIHNHMVVGDDVAIRAHDDARTGATRAGRDIDCLDRDDGGRNLGVDLLARQAVVRRTCGRRGGGDVDGRQIAVRRRDRRSGLGARAGKRAADRDAAGQQDTGRRNRADYDRWLAVVFALPLCPARSFLGALGCVLVFLPHPFLVGCVGRMRGLAERRLGRRVLLRFLCRLIALAAGLGPVACHMEGILLEAIRLTGNILLRLGILPVCCTLLLHLRRVSIIGLIVFIFKIHDSAPFLFDLSLLYAAIVFLCCHKYEDSVNL